MASTNQTTNYGLPIYSSGDRASWVDTNQPFEAIDSAVHNAVETAEDAAGDVAGAVSAANEAKELALEAKASVTTMSTTKQNVTDGNLDTDSKTVVGGINEVYGYLKNIIKVVPASSSNINYVAGNNDIMLAPDEPITGYTPLGLISANVFLSGAERNIFGFKFENNKAVISCTMSVGGIGSASAKILCMRSSLIS